MHYSEVKLNQAERFTATDHAVLESFFPVVDALGDLLGPNCEVVLHSLEDMERSVVKIANGSVTGRHEGAPITDLSLHMLQQMRANGAHFSESYFTRSKNGRLMKSTTAAIRNIEGKVIALLCINFDLDAPMSDFINHFTPFAIQSTVAAKDELPSSPEQVVERQLREISGEVSQDSSIPSKQKNRQIIYRLFELGVFDYKDATNMAAAFLNISRHTVYLYIREYRRTNSTLDLCDA